jgi:hypothetical protein
MWSAALAEERIVAVGLLTQREVELLGHGFSRLWPVDETPRFQELLKAIDDADREFERAHAEEMDHGPALEGGAAPGGGRY